MRVLVTGSNGFIGKNLISHIQELEDVEVLRYDKDDSFDFIRSNIEKIDFIFHLAGVNRPNDISEFYSGNTDLTNEIISLLKDKKLNVPIVITSSIQAVRDNDYGKSKKMAEDLVLSYDYGIVYRLHNVFGKWCRPNYNSVIATFCNNIANDLDITVNDEKTELDLIYIDDIVREFINIMYGQNPSEKIDNYCYINPRYNVTLGYIVKLLKEFKNSMNSIYVPKTGDDFVKKLYSTYVSYVPLEEMCNSAMKNVDDRGSFTELVRTYDSGQFSISFSKPGIVRGNHYHHTKMERFIVIKGTARIRFTSIIDNSSYEFEVDDNDIQIVTIPVGYTHNIENIGNDEMILAIWCNELFDEKNPDTYFKPINNNNIKKIK